MDQNENYTKLNVNQESGYMEKVLIIYRKCWIIVSILLFLILGGVIALFAVLNKPYSTIVIVICSIVLVLVELIIQCVSPGVNACIDNVNKRIIFKRKGGFFCCGNKSYAFSDLQRVEYQAQSGSDQNGNYIIILIEAVLKNMNRECVYRMKVGGSLASESAAGVASDIKETLNQINNILSNN